MILLTKMFELCFGHSWPKNKQWPWRSQLIGNELVELFSMLFHAREFSWRVSWREWLFSQRFSIDFLLDEFKNVSVFVINP